MESTHYDRNQQCHPVHGWISSNINRQLNRAYSNITKESSEPSPAIEESSENTLINLRSGAIQVNSTNSLGIDEASLDIITDAQLPGNVMVLIQVVECMGCPYETLANALPPSQALNLTFNTKYTYRVRIEFNNMTVCRETLNLYEHGQYVFNIQSNGSAVPTNGSLDTGIKCTLITRRSSNNIYIPLIVGGVIVLVLFIACIVAQRVKLTEKLLKMKERIFNRVPSQQSQSSYDLQQTHVTSAIVGSSAISPHITNHHHETTTATIDSVENHKSIPPLKTTNVTVSRSKRLLSLDAFRGVALVSMIFVNYGGGGYSQFDHVPWHGITFADFVFPWFVWIMGVSITFSLKSSLDNNVRKRILLWKVLLRVIKLFLLGFILNTRFKVFLSEVRILGILQRFAVVYGITATIEVLCARKHMFSSSTDHLSTVGTTTTAKTTTNSSKRLLNIFRDIIHFPLQWLTIIGLTTLWMLIIYLVPFGDCPAGYLGPGYIDRKIFSEKHIYGNPTCRLVYGCSQAFDPENLLVMYQRDLDRLIRLIAWGIVTTAIGIGLTAGTLDSGPMPLNKNLWTLSFSLFTGLYILRHFFHISSK
ncbi:unnamed protein product [Didymodactylos carnosus]|uniref:Heparan-alpha-glucosaminide N-acetyltransferase catalytic domain-containing protein n=1 Tax=Didymodactylos carnosus TaxID=1234261 RepID=A0A813T2V5_9BILA|nr:unnamed protein product [Didymodactylos carnosus]CAF3591001.1 unnamed protein product [Didymodactylos carnosus]